MTYISSTGTTSIGGTPSVSAPGCKPTGVTGNTVTSTGTNYGTSVGAPGSNKLTGVPNTSSYNNPKTGGTSYMQSSASTLTGISKLDGPVTSVPPGFNNTKEYASISAPECKYVSAPPGFISPKPTGPGVPPGFNNPRPVGAVGTAISAISAPQGFNKPGGTPTTKQLPFETTPGTNPSTSAPNTNKSTGASYENAPLSNPSTSANKSTGAFISAPTGFNSVASSSNNTSGAPEPAYVTVKAKK